LPWASGKPLGYLIRSLFREIFFLAGEKALEVFGFVGGVTAVLGG